MIRELRSWLARRLLERLRSGLPVRWNLLTFTQWSGSIRGHWCSFCADCYGDEVKILGGPLVDCKPYAYGLKDFEGRELVGLVGASFRQLRNKRYRLP